MEVVPFSEISVDSFFVYESEVLKMAIRVASQLVGEAKNASSSGGEVEMAFREILERKLSKKYYVSQGHIVDRNLKVSQQCDVIIADNFRTPTLYRTRNSTEFIMYESVYAIGEIKKSWYDKDIIKDFAMNTMRVKKELERADTPSNLIGTLGKGIYVDQQTSPYKQNPLLTFIFIGEGAYKFKKSHIDELYLNTDWWDYLPNIVCIMDVGILVNINKTVFEENKIFKVNLYPEFLPKEERCNSQWVILELKSDAKHLAYFYYLLLEHLNLCSLMPPVMISYLNGMFSVPAHQVTTLKKSK